MLSNAEVLGFVGISGSGGEVCGGKLRLGEGSCIVISGGFRFDVKPSPIA